MSEVKTIRLTPAEYASLLDALDFAIEYCAEYSLREYEFEIIGLKDAIKSC